MLTIVAITHEANEMILDEMILDEMISKYAKSGRN